MEINRSTSGTPDWYFIQGIHRSGTTILGTWLQETNVFRTLTLGDIVRISEDPAYSRLFDTVFHGAASDIRRLKSLLGQINRGFDDVHVDSEMFEEYSHLTMDEPPFGKWAELLTGRRPWAHFNPKHVFKLKPSNIHRFVALSRILGERDARPQLHKSPFDIANPYIYRLKARHIFVFRDPIDILASMLRQVQDNYRRRIPYIAAVSRFYRESYRSWWYRAASLYGGPSPLGVRVLRHRVVTELNTQMDLMNTLDDDAYVCVDYDQMCRDDDSPGQENPYRDHTVGYILRAFGLPTDGIRKIRAKTRRRANHVPSSVRRLEPSIVRSLPRYYRKMRQVREALDKDFTDRSGLRQNAKPTPTPTMRRFES
ncbi:MAG: hypothetical protein R6X21_01075 [Candidatus Aminicenantes bacterium]